MSTAGKVLTVLVLLVSMVWLVMMSAVTQLNVNWQTKLNAQQTELEKATLEFARSSEQAVALTEQARVTQDTLDRELRLRLTKLGAIDRRRSSVTEDLSRVKAQVTDAQASAETAKANLAIREQEKIKGQENLASKRDEIAKSQAANAELKTQLAQLQDEFKRILGENVANLDKAAKKGAAKPASSVRESPSS